MERGTFKTQRISMRELANILDITPSSSGRISFNQLYDKLEWNLVDLPKRTREKMSMGFFRGKTIVPVWPTRMTCFPPRAMTNYIQVLDGVDYKVTFSSYEDFFTYPPQNLLDQNPTTYSRTLPNVYDTMGKYTGGGRSVYDQDSVLKGEWVQLSMDVYVVALKITITPTYSRPAEAPRKFTVLGQTPDGTWVVLLRALHTQPYIGGDPVDFHITRLVTCSSFRLVCEETSSETGITCKSFSLADMRVFGVTERDATPQAIVSWKNGSQYVVKNSMSDVNLLEDGLGNNTVTRVECRSGTTCLMYSGVKYAGLVATIASGTQQTLNNMIGSLQLNKTSPVTLQPPFNFDGTLAAFTFGSPKAKRTDNFTCQVTCDGSLATEFDATRGYVLKLTFGVASLNTPTLAVPKCFTLCVWLLRGSKTEMNRILVTPVDELHISSTSSGMLRCKIGDVILVDEDPDGVEGSWIHYAVSFDGTTLKLYRNGVLTAFQKSEIPSWLGATSLTVGRDWNYNARILVDNIRVYNIAIPSNTLKHLFDFEYYNPLF